MNWLIRDHQTGRVVVLQRPNVLLAIFLLATAARILLHPSGTAVRMLGLAGTVALVIWAALELVWGRSPFRRILGGVVLAAQLAALLIR